MKAKSGFLRRLGAAALAAGVIVGALAVNVQPASAAKKFKVEEKKYEKSYELKGGKTFYELSYVYPVITDNSAAAKKINSSLTKQRKNWIKDAKKAEGSYRKEMEDLIKEYPDEELSLTYSDGVTYKVTNNDGKYFSVVMSGYLYTGGAHGMPYRICSTFDAKTGDKLTAAKILGTTKAGVNEKVKKLYLNKYDKKGAEAGFYDGFSGNQSGRKTLENSLKSLNFNNAFYMKNGKLVFYADPYVLGPYAAGFIEVSASVK